jgi:hypothetical protein
MMDVEMEAIQSYTSLSLVSFAAIFSRYSQPPPRSEVHISIVFPRCGGNPARGIARAYNVLTSAHDEFELQIYYGRRPALVSE